MADTLDAIGLRNGTDKASSHHNYLGVYESFMAPLREEPITLLEIGVYQGASLRTWREYFPNAKILGVDILPTCKQFQTDRIAVELADQSNLQHLADLAARHGPFDIIVEDGSHMWEHQITTLRALFPFVRNGGYYVVEDLQTNYGELQAKYRGVASESCVDFLKRWMDVFVAHDLIDLAEIEDPFLRTYGRGVEYLKFHRRACVIRKRTTETDWKVSRGLPLAPKPEGALSVVMNAHIGLRGDVFGAWGYVDEGDDRFTIQGLSIETETRALEYRVRFPDKSWGEWMPEGAFAGTRGQAMPITGFAARLAEPLSSHYEIQTRGLFVGGIAVDALGGFDCVPPEDQKMRGLQVAIRPLTGQAEAAPD